ncbi:metallophosphoesterase family protein [Paenibacillus sp. GYB003]|uniref:metallophosphoesterase family protein n=1 Tax=Paenibacillus sp. GYB003 TaxID=2994392 RepID=UPI002F966289
MNGRRVLPVLLAIGAGLSQTASDAAGASAVRSADGFYAAASRSVSPDAVRGANAITPLPFVRTEPDRPLASFSLLSDIHIQQYDKTSHRLFMKALQDHYSIKPDANMLVLNGDLTNGEPADFDTLRRLLDRVPHAPVHATMGNHDYYRMWRHGDRYDYTRLGREWSSEKAVAQFTGFFGYAKPYHEAFAGGVPFLFMSGEAYRDADDSIAEDAYLSDAQLDWLEARLAEHRARRAAAGRDGRKPRIGAASPDTAAEVGEGRSTAPAAKAPALVFLHQPLPGTLDGTSAGLGVVQHERLRAILERYPFAVLLSGHTHWDVETTKQLWRGSFAAVGSGSVRSVYGADNEPVKPDKSESLFVDVYAGRLVIWAIDHGSGRWIGEPAVIAIED